MFDLLVFIAATAMIVLGVSLAVSILIGNVLRSRTDYMPVLIDGVWHHSHCNKAVNPTYICSCAPELLEWNDDPATTYEQRVTLVTFLKECAIPEQDVPYVHYRSAKVWVVDGEGGVEHA
jgi:hypothetical protein